MDSAVFKGVCRVLHNAAPQEWVMFVDMFEEYTHEALHGVLYANKDSLLEAQSAAKQCRAILDAFKTCDQTSASP